MLDEGEREKEIYFSPAWAYGGHLESGMSLRLPKYARCFVVSLGSMSRERGNMYDSA